MRTWLDKYAKNLVGSLLTRVGKVSLEHEIVSHAPRVDVLFQPDSGVSQNDAELGVLGRMAACGLCLIEPYSKPPRLREFRFCQNKQLMQYHQLDSEARRQRESEPPLPFLWLVSRGRPETLIRSLEMTPMAGWPPGCLEMPGELGDALRVHLIVVRDLPETPETLFLRLLGYPKALSGAMKEVDRMPRGSGVRRAVMRTLVAWQHKIAETSSESDRETKMQLAEMEAIYAKWEKEAQEKGVQKGMQKGERAIVRKLLALKFGALSAAVERRLSRASVADLERWTERVLSAQTLNDVFE